MAANSRRAPHAPEPAVRLVAASGPRNALDRRRPHLAAVPRRRRRRPQPVAAMPGVQRLSVDKAVEGGGASRRPSASRHSPSSRTPTRPPRPTGSEAINPENLVCAGPRDQESRPQPRRHRRRGARPLHEPRPRRDHGGRGDRQRCQRRAALRAGADRGGSRRRRDRALGHDGRPRRRDPRALDGRDTSTSRSWPTRRNTPPRSTGRSATRSARPRRSKGDKRTYQMDPGERRRGAP